MGGFSAHAEGVCVNGDVMPVIGMSRAQPSLRMGMEVWNPKPLGLQNVSIPKDPLIVEAILQWRFPKSWGYPHIIQIRPF